jgi:hypothetical protein
LVPKKLLPWALLVAARRNDRWANILFFTYSRWD